MKTKCQFLIGKVQRACGWDSKKEMIVSIPYR